MSLDMDKPKFERRGLHNWRNLMRKPTFQEWVILIMLIMALFMSWAYNRDTAYCRELIKNYENIEALACDMCGKQIEKESNSWWNNSYVLWNSTYNSTYNTTFNTTKNIFNEENVKSDNT